MIARCALARARTRARASECATPFAKSRVLTAASPLRHTRPPSRSPAADPAIAPMVKAICKKHGVRYNYEPTFVAAWGKHVRMLYEMGQKGFKYHWD